VKQCLVDSLASGKFDKFFGEQELRLTQSVNYLFNEKFATMFRQEKKNFLTKVQFEKVIAEANFDSSMEAQLLAQFDSLDIDEYNN
jgi:hypothetical protein